MNTDASPEMKAEICKSLSNLTKFSPIMKDEIRTAGGIKVLLEILGGSPDETLQLESAITLCNSVTDNDENKKIVGELGAAAIVIHLSSMNASVLEYVTSIFEQLSSTEASRKYLDEIGGVASLLSLLQACTNFTLYKLTQSSIGAWKATCNANNFC
jgi:hypothetical protein